VSDEPFFADRDLLFTVAYEMLGSAARFRKSRSSRGPDRV
jgi:hypothetical protein